MIADEALASWTMTPSLALQTDPFVGLRPSVGKMAFVGEITYP